MPWKHTHRPYNCVGLHMNGAIALWAKKKNLNVGDERNLSAAHYPVPLHPNVALLDRDVLTMKAIRVQWTHCHVNLLKMAIRRWVQCGHKGTGMLLNRLLKHLIGTKAPEVCKENIPVFLHHYHQPEQNRVDPCLRDVYTKFWPYNLNLTVDIKTHRFPVVQFWWICVNL